MLLTGVEKKNDDTKKLFSYQQQMECCKGHRGARLQIPHTGTKKKTKA